MLTRLKARLSSAHVIALLALFFAIAGGSAIALQGKNSVDSGDIKRNAVKSPDIAKNAVTSAKLRNEGVRAVDLGAGSVGTSEIQDRGVGAADLPQAEAWHTVGAAGEPPFGNGGQGDCVWSSFLTDIYTSVAFHKDPFGVVRLTGIADANVGSGGDQNCDAGYEDASIFVLPPGYRPTRAITFPEDGGKQIIVNGSTATEFGPPGQVLGYSAVGAPEITLSQVSFREGQ
jgi:hypothetical protein